MNKIQILFIINKLYLKKGGKEKRRRKKKMDKLFYRQKYEIISLDLETNRITFLNCGHSCDGKITLREFIQSGDLPCNKCAELEQSIDSCLICSDLIKENSTSIEIGTHHPASVHHSHFYGKGNKTIVVEKGEIFHIKLPGHHIIKKLEYAKKYFTVKEVSQLKFKSWFIHLWHVEVQDKFFEDLEITSEIRISFYYHAFAEPDSHTVIWTIKKKEIKK